MSQDEIKIFKFKQELPPQWFVLLIGPDIFSVTTCHTHHRFPEGGGAHLYFKMDIIHVKKIHVIRVVFQDQTMYARTSFRVSKTC